jgi:nitrous oxidase accessory protein
MTRRRYTILVVALAASLATTTGWFTKTFADTLVVSPRRELKSISSAVGMAENGDSIIVKGGYYRESGIEIDKSISLIGENFPVIDGAETDEILTVRARGVRISGFVIKNVGVSYMSDRAAVRLVDVSECTIDNNCILNGFFAIYLENSDRCRIANNQIHGNATRETSSGNGIHLWYCRDITVENNDISGHRDGIYFEFVENSVIMDNHSERNLRYGLHFMFSHDDTYTRNVFRNNGAGVAVMYSDRVIMNLNRFEHNWGPASYGLLLKDIRDSEIAANVFHHNTIGLYSEGSIRVKVSLNDFLANGYAIKLMASSSGNQFTKNNFMSNSFEVTTNSRQNFNEFQGNYWSSYQGYDLDGDGIGDVPHHPVNLFSLLVEREPAVIVLLRSFFVRIVDAAEKAFPIFTPETLIDRRPRIHRVEPPDLGRDTVEATRRASRCVTINEGPPTRMR